jgi:putative holliday junction resolvase
MQTATKTVLALDVGASRIGVALSSLEARLARPLTTLKTPTALKDIEDMIEEYHVAVIVVGLPRGLSGQNTAQTQATEDFIDDLKQHISIPIRTQDEAVTSAQAENELKDRGKPYMRGDIDALAATYILEDYLRDNPLGASNG